MDWSRTGEKQVSPLIYDYYLLLIITTTMKSAEGQYILLYILAYQPCTFSETPTRTFFQEPIAFGSEPRLELSGATLLQALTPICV
jgi:hypothetical protein